MSQRNGNRTLAPVLVLFGLLLSLSNGVSFAKDAPLIKCEDPLKKDIIIHTDSDSPAKSMLSREVYELTVQKRGPYHKPIAVKVQNGEPTLFGTLAAIEASSSTVASLKGIIFGLTGASSGDQPLVVNTSEAQVKVHQSIGLVGSAARTDFFSDLDLETSIITEYDGFTPDDFHRSNSPAIAAVAAYIQTRLKESVAKGYEFSEAKLGEYDYVPQAAKSTHSRAVKWSFAEIQRGYKDYIHEISGKKVRLSLEEALTSESRLKLDFFLKVPNTAAIKELTGKDSRHIESSMILFLAGMRPKSPPLLRVSKQTIFPEPGATGGHLAINGRPYAVPLRPTSVFFDAHHMNWALRLSLTAPPPDIHYLNMRVSSVVRTYLDQGNILKVLKILKSRLYYWSDFRYFQVARPDIAPSQSSGFALQQAINSIVFDSELISANLLLESLKVLKKIESNGKITEASDRESLNYLYSQVMEVSEEVAGRESLETLAHNVEHFIQSHVESKLSKLTNLKAYLDWFLTIEPQKVFSEVSKTTTFVSLDIPEALRQKLVTMVDKLKVRYPGIKFHSPDKFHMTMAYFGRVPVAQEAALNEALAHFQKRIASTQLRMSDANLVMMGRQNDYLSFSFENLEVDPEFQAALLELKQRAFELGAQPDDFLVGFKPHVSIAHNAGGFQNGLRTEIHSLFSQEFDTEQLSFSLEAPKATIHRQSTHQVNESVGENVSPDDVVPGSGD